MKKKIKDFTEQEKDDICNNHHFCSSCPFSSKSGDFRGCYLLDEELWRDLEIEYEI